METKSKHLLFLINLCVAFTSIQAETIQTRETMGDSAYYSGGIATSMTIGAGIGHAVQGRWLEKGWIFTVLAVGLPVVSALAVRHPHSAMLGFTVYVPVHIWEIYDIWTPPSAKQHISLAKDKSINITTYSIPVVSWKF